MTIFNRDHEPPSPDEIDTAHAVSRAILSGVPVIGGALVEVLNKVIAPPLAKRQVEWMEDVAEAIRRLETERGIPGEQLRDNPAFIDAVLSATNAAVRTSQEGKRSALRNALLNSALPGAPEITVQQTFIGLIDGFTDWHVLILQLFQDPTPVATQVGYRPAISSTLSALLEKAYPSLRGKRDIYDLVWADLNAAGLVNSGSMHVMMTAGGAMEKRTTALGDRFLTFIKDPFEE